MKLKFTDDLLGMLQYESGNTINSNAGQLPVQSNTSAPAGTTTYEWYVDLTYNLAYNPSRTAITAIHAQWFQQAYGGGLGDYTNFYRIQFDYSY